jgi:hypothetical protein
MINPLPVPTELLNDHLKQTFGTQACIASWEPLTGGARKKVFRLDLADSHRMVVLLVWQNEQDYFGERDNRESIRSDQQAPLLYRANTELLLRHGVKVPALNHFDISYRDVPFSYALVEYLQASTFNEWKKARSIHEVQVVLAKVHDYLYKMHAIRRDSYGTLLDDLPKPIPCHEKVLKDTFSELSNLANAFEVVGQNEGRVIRKLEDLYSCIAPRNQYSFIHDELGPDEHLLIDAKGDIAIIDVDGCQFWDLEREYAYLKLRFGPYYASLKRDDLDDARMQFYGLCLHISAAHGHYQLYRKGFPDAEMLKSIYEWNIRETLRIT